MCLTAYKDVTVKLSLDWGERFKISPRDNLVAVDEADFEITDLYSLCLWKSCDLKRKLESYKFSSENNANNLGVNYEIKFG